MHEANEHLRELARRIVDAALERVPLRAALLVGSAGRGDADYFSDLDLLMYVDELPTDETLDKTSLCRSSPYNLLALAGSVWFNTQKIRQSRPTQ